MTMQIDPARLAKLNTMTLSYGAHRDQAKGMCALEAVAWLAGEEHSDHPACVCPVVAAFVRTMNDRLRDDKERARLLRPLLPVLIGTRSSPAVERRRAYLAADWAVRTSMPMLLRALGHEEWAARLEACAPVTDRETALAVRDVAREVRAAADAAAAYAAAAAAYAADAAAADAADAAYAAYAAAYAAYAAAADAADAAYAAEAAYAAAAEAKLEFTRVAIWESAADLIKRMCEVQP